MAGEWQTTTLLQFCSKPNGGIQTGPFGSQLHRADYVDSGVPVIMPTNIRDGRLAEEGIARISEAKADELKRHRVRLGDIIFSRRGEVDKCAVVAEREVDWLCGTGCLLARVDPTRADPRYIGYHIRLPETRAWLQQNAVGLVMPNLNTAILERIPIHAPSRDEQEKIADLLASLDAKINLNRQIAATLEEMAQALFKSWFVDFDPVRAKAEGRNTGLPDDIAALFPDACNDEGLPPGWFKQPVEAYLHLAYGKSLPATAREAGEIPVYGSGGVGGYHNQALVSGPGIIVGRKGSVGALYWEQGDFFPIDTVFYVKPKDGYSLPFLWEMLRTFPLSEMNADGAVPGLNRSHALQLEFPCPPPPLRHVFDMFSMSTIARVEALKSEQAAAMSLRDALLPKLLSGELRVADAETVIAAA